MKQTKLKGPIDLSTASSDDIAAYISALEQTLSKTQEQNTKITQVSPDAGWTGKERRWMLIQNAPDGQPIRINGKPYIGRCLVTLDEFHSVMEIYFRAVKSELQRLQQRGNLVPPQLLPQDEVASRTQSQVIANL